MAAQTLASPVVEHPNGDASPGRQRRPSRWDRPKPPKDWRWWVGGTGRILIVLGLLMFAFVAYQLWGTGIQQAQAQDDLQSQLEEFEESLSTAPTTTVAPTTTTGSTPTDSTTPTTAPPTTAAPDPLLEVVEGDPIGVIEIPSIGVKEFIVAGVRTEDLRKGPGHYPFTPFPGQLGNASVAGHRTTYGHPFLDLDQLQPGDEIRVTMLGDKHFVYRVTGSTIVSPEDYEVILTADPTVATLTLTTCHPAYTAKQRLIVSSVLDAEASDPVDGLVIDYQEPPTTEPSSTEVPDDPTVTTVAGAPGTTVASPDDVEQTADAFDEGWFSDPDAWPQVVLWGLILALVCTLSYAIARSLRRVWVGIVVGLVPFVLCLYFFFENVNRLLPPNL